MILGDLVEFLEKGLYFDFVIQEGELKDRGYVYSQSSSNKESIPNKLTINIFMIGKKHKSIATMEMHYYPNDSSNGDGMYTILISNGGSFTNCGLRIDTIYNYKESNIIEIEGGDQNGGCKFDFRINDRKWASHGRINNGMNKSISLTYMKYVGSAKNIYFPIDDISKQVSTNLAPLIEKLKKELLQDVLDMLIAKNEEFKQI